MDREACRSAGDRGSAEVAQPVSHGDAIDAPPCWAEQEIVMRRITRHLGHAGAPCCSVLRCSARHRARTMLKYGKLQADRKVQLERVVLSGRLALAVLRRRRALCRAEHRSTEQQERQHDPECQGDPAHYDLLCRPTRRRVDGVSMGDGLCDLRTASDPPARAARLAVRLPTCPRDAGRIMRWT